jgi:hypothetical protein
MCGLWPYEATALQPLRKQTHPIVAPPKNLHAITGTSAENKQLTGERILGQLHLHESRQSIKAFARMHCNAFAQLCAAHQYAESSAIHSAIDVRIQHLSRVALP